MQNYFVQSKLHQNPTACSVTLNIPHSNGIIVSALKTQTVYCQ